MNAGRDVERTISDWLVEEAPARAPDRILEAARERATHTRQRRLGALRRTFPTMKISWQLATVAAVGIVLVVAGAAYLGRTPNAGVGGGPTTSPSPATSPIATPWATLGPLTRTFTSPLQGYALRYPDSWSVTPSTMAWPPGKGQNWGSPGLDEFLNAAALQDATVRFDVESQPLPPGQTADAWMRVVGKDFGDPGGWPRIAVGDQQGWLYFDGTVDVANRLVSGEHGFFVMVVVGGRGYDISIDGAVDRAYLDALFATFTFDPASAVDPSPTP
ncbi:MAG: hypothetical protein ACRDF7_01475 [Candidatus Limnocylindrales bacterium]